MGELKEVLLRCAEGKSKDGHTFPIYTVKTKDGVWIKAKIRKDVTNAPMERGLYNIVIGDESNVSSDFFGAVLWIGKIHNIMKAERKTNIYDMF